MGGRGAHRPQNFVQTLCDFPCFSYTVCEIAFTFLGMDKQDQDKLTSTGLETVREAKRRGAKQSSHKGHSHAQERGSALTPLGTTWLQVRRDWETGAFTLRGLADAHSVPVGTLRYRMAKEVWGDRPIAPAVQAALPGLVEDPSPRDSSVETVLAAIEGRAPDPDVTHKERASNVAQRKAVVLRGHRQISDQLQVLYSKSVKLLDRYMDGELPFSFVKTKNERGEDMYLPFRLVSAQHGLFDGLDKVAKIAERLINIQRKAHGLEGVDGDGNPIKPNGSGATNILAGLREDEILTKVDGLMTALKAPTRLTPVPELLRVPTDA